MVVGSLTFAVAAPPPHTAAVLVTLAGAFPPTFTVTLSAGQLLPAPHASLPVQVSVASVHVQPVPPMAAAVNPAGKASVTATVPPVAPVPLLVTAME